MSLVILAIGLLGHMALQMTSLSSNQSSYFRSQASIIANEMADRMRMNPTGVDNGKYDAIDTDGNNYADPNCNNSGCAPDEQADFDLNEWEVSIDATIPGGIGTIQRDPAIVDQAVFTIAITWNSQDKTGLPNAATINRFVMDIGI